MSSSLSALPSVDRLLNTARLRAAQDTYGRASVTAAVRAHLDGLRTNARRDVPPIEEIARTIDAGLSAAARPSLRKVVNLTGTVLHTNLGRAILPEAAVSALTDAARHPCNLEYDVDEGGRGERDAHVEGLIRTLTGAEAALVVNNNAAAVFLVLETLARRREVVVSRGELVEIGGQFRIPDIMARSGAKLREVGTTNRTHLSDYSGAIGPRTALLLKVHTSNYEVRGFTSAVDVESLAPLARERRIPLVVDLGSGTLLDMRQWGLSHEPTVQEAIAAGADLVTFSGDKLLGGPQCGIVAGRKQIVDPLRRNPLKRALRVDKLVIAALEQVLRLYLDPDRLRDALPTLRTLTRKVKDIRPVAAKVAHALESRMGDGFVFEVVDCASQIGSGALPVDVLPSSGVRATSKRPRRERDRHVRALEMALRALPVPVIGRIDDHALLLDCRCVDDPRALLATLEALSPQDAPTAPNPDASR